MRLLISIPLLLFACAIAAQQPEPLPDLTPLPEPPEIPDSVPEGETLEPEITVIEREEETVEEYRINGQLYMVKITPSAGLAYYLIDTDGDGRLETRTDNLQTPNIPQWVLFSWG